MPVDDLVYGWAEMDAAMPDYVRAEDAAAGRVEELFPDPVLEAKLAPLADRYRFPLAAIPVEVLADRIELRDVVAESEPLNTRIADISKANKLETRWPDLIQMTLLYGDAYLMTWPAPDAPPGGGVASQMLAAAGVTVDVQNPKHCRVFYDEESERIPAFAIKRWEIRTALGRAWRADLYYPGMVERWQSKVGETPTRPETWDPYGDPDAVPGTDNAHILTTPTPDELPFTHFRTGLPYGKPVHEAIYGCQDAATKMLVTQLDSTDSHGWPQRWRLLTLGSELDQAHDAPWRDDDTDGDDTRYRDGSTPTGQPSGPGTIQTFTGTSSVGQFEAATPSVFIDPAQLYIRLMGLLSHTPTHYFDPMGGVPSGESLKVANMPLVKRAGRFETLFGGSIQEFWDYALRVAGMRPTQLVDVQWAPAWAAVGTSDWEEVAAKQTAGVPIPDTLVEAGYDRARVEEWKLPDHPADFEAPAPTTMPVAVPGSVVDVGVPDVIPPDGVGA
jgi:hypothetical protein